MSSTSAWRWLRVDAAAFDKDEKVVRRGVEFHVLMSPYDLPEAVRGGFDQTLHRFVIEFRYVTDEPVTPVVSDKHVTFFVGQNSKRLRRIAVDVDGLGADQIVVRIDRAIDTLPAALHSARVPTANFEVAKTVIHKKQPELLGAFG